MLPEHLDAATAQFYRDAMHVLHRERAPYLVGGAYAFERYTGVARHSKDFDIFVRQSDAERVLCALATLGCHTEVTFPHWLGKAIRGKDFVDVIYASGNGVAVVDDLWFDHATRSQVLGVDTLLIPAEEMIWSKAFIMERERFDGADVAHILHARADELDWERLMWRFDRHWRVLYAHLVLFGFIYPGERARIPRAVLRRFAADLDQECATSSDEIALCQGTILSREQYLPDLQRGYEDARRRDDIQMTDDDIALWTAGIATDGAGVQR